MTNNIEVRRLLILFVALAACVAARAQAKYLFYFIGDGMGTAQVAAADLYNRTIAPERSQLLMMQLPVASLAKTYSASSPVTDSAAAGTALATGYKTRNSMLGMTPDSVAVSSIATELHDRGWAVGIVTSVAVDDATPAAFYAHRPSRSQYLEIGRDYAASGFEFIAGAGLRGLVDKKGHDTGLMRTLTDSDIHVSRSVEASAASTARRKMLLSPDSVRTWNVGFTIDSVAGYLDLPTMTRAAIDHLQTVSPERFFLMVEGGNIDHAGHANDAGAVIKEVRNFDQALAVAYDFYLAHPDETLIVVTADHETGGMSIGNNTTGYAAFVGLADSQRISKDIFAEMARSILDGRAECPDWPQMQQFLREHLGLWESIPVNDEQTRMLRDSYRRTFVERIDDSQITLYSKAPRFVVDVFAVLNDAMGIGWTTMHHTGNPVPVYAAGVGADRLGHMLDNTDIPAAILSATR